MRFRLVLLNNYTVNIRKNIFTFQDFDKKRAASSSDLASHYSVKLTRCSRPAAKHEERRIFGRIKYSPPRRIGRQSNLATADLRSERAVKSGSEVLAKSKSYVGDTSRERSTPGRMLDFNLISKQPPTGINRVQRINIYVSFN